MIPPLLAPALVRHQGVLLAFAVTAGQTGTAVYYDTLDLAAGEPDDASAWSGFRPLALPGTLRPAGLTLVDVEADAAAVKPAPEGPIEVVSDGTQLYLFRLSTKGTPLVNRLVMVDMGTDRVTKRPVREVHPAWEVRFAGTGQRDVAAGPGDSQRFTDPDGKPYEEPTIELSMIRVAAGGNVAVELVPADNGTRLRWQVFAATKAGTVSSWSFERDEAGMFDLSNLSVDSGTLTVPPESTFSPTLAGTSPGPIELTTGLTAQLYAKQERIATGSAAGSSAKRSIRLLLAAGVKPSGAQGSTAGTMLIDFALGVGGDLAPIPEEPALGTIAPANNTLEFDGTAAVTLDDAQQPLSLSGPFTLEAWVYPTAAAGSPASLVIGGEAASPGSSPPSLTMSPGAGFAVSFGTGQATVTCATTSTALKSHAWQHLCASFDGTGLSLYLNGETAPSQVSGTIGPPPGKPIAAIGGVSPSGFLGTIDEVRVWNVARSASEVRATMLAEIAEPPASLVGYWTFDQVEIDYSTTPPPRVTPDRSTYGNVGTLAGPRQIPSTAPIALATAATPYTTAGLTITAGIAPFAKPETTPALLDGADGLVHLYFGDADEELCAAQYDATIARAGFAVPWEAGNQRGHMTLVARSPGRAANQSAISVSGEGAKACSLSLADGSTRTESWKGAPNELVALLTVLSGQAYSRPTDPGLASGSGVFYDYAGIYRQVRAPAGPGQLVVADTNARLRLDSVSFEATTGKLSIALTRPGWTGGVTQTWPGLPSDVAALLAVLSGLSGKYDYSSVSLSALPAYTLAAEGGTLSFAFDPGRVGSAAIGIADATASGDSDAKLTISVTPAQGPTLNATWDQVPRLESRVAAILEGDDPGYDYAANAAGDYKEVSALLIAIDDDLDGTVANQTAVALNRPQFVSSQYRAFATGGSGAIASFSATATITQGATASPGPGDLSSGSQLFAALGDGGPTNGIPAIVQQVAAAPMVQAGTAGGWIAQEADYGLEFDGSGAVGVDVTQPAGDELAMPGDMAMEAWVCGSGETSSPYPRIVHCHRQLDPSDPLTESEYGMGLFDSHYLQFVEGTALEASAIEKALSLASYSLQLWVNPALKTLGQSSGTIWSLTGAGQLGARLSIEPNGALKLALPGGASLTSSGKLDSGAWRQISVVRDRGDVSIYLDGELDSTIAGVQAEIATPDALALGGNKGAYALEMKANDVRVWNRPLASPEVAAGARGPISPDMSGLTILWPLTEEGGATVANVAAATTPAYQGSVTVKPNSSPLWLTPGVYLGFFANRLGLGRRSVGGVAAIGGWVHLAASYRSGKGLRLAGADYADAGNDASLDLNAELSIEAWALPSAAPNTDQVLVSKWGTSEDEQSYELGLDPDMCPYLKIWGSDGELYAAQATTPLSVGTIAHLVGTFAVRPTEPTQAKTPGAGVIVEISLYRDGQLIAGGNAEEVEHGVSVNLSGASLNFGRNRPEDDDPGTGSAQSCFTGIIAGVSLWSRALSATEVGDGGVSLPSALDTTGLVSAWSFSEMRGNVAKDVNEVNDAVLSSNGLWCRFSPTAELALYADGLPVNAEPLNLTALGSYGTNRFQIGACPDGSGNPREGLSGQMSELRVWAAQRTQEQIADLMHQALSGTEAGLAGYWPLDDASGLIAVDASGHGNSGELIPVASRPAWVPSTAPLATEPPEARNVLGGIETDLTATITSAPAVAEYAESERDAYGRTTGVMKRALAYVSGGTIVNADGFRVGELDQQFIGQVQTEPTLVGFVEGAPPLPSENLTRPVWGAPGSVAFYAGTSAVTLTESDEAVRTISSTKTTGGDLFVDARAGLLLSSKGGVAAVAWFETTRLVGHAALRFKTTFSAETEEASAMSESAVRSTSVALGVNGDWETADAVLNPEVGRRWLPDNTGLAVVRSFVADLYALRLKGTGTLVSLITVPNLEIPEDVNFIGFPLNPTYVKNGTLDGKVGVVDDPDYPDADVDRGSYFKPLEAYRLQRQVERQTAALEALYEQFDAGARGRSGEADITTEEEGDPWYDKATAMARRDIANTYVWTAGGGLYKEQEQFTASRSESISGKYRLNTQGGVHLDGEFAYLVGSYAELDALGGGHVDVTATKRRSDSAAFGLDVNLTGDRYLHAFNGQVPDAEPAPGKVEAYRFMSAYLAPSKENAETFFSKVVDPDWLANGNDDYAVALREAQTGTNPAWRLLHRTTYVRRIPPTFDQDPVPSSPPALTPPPDVRGNAELIELVKLAIPVPERLDPTPAVLGAAIATVLESSLKKSLPWWKAFLASAAVVGSPAATTLRRLRHDLLAYMIALYASANAEPTLELPI